MSSRGRSISNNGGGGVGIQSIPAASRRMIQSLKEIVNCPEPEIYSMLKECNMDPNEAVNRLLSQDPFHEVKSKREKKKENEVPTESRSRGVGSRGTKSATDRDVGRGGLIQSSYSESGASHSKSAYKKENGTNPYTTSYSASGMAGSNTNRQPLVLSDSITTENISTTIKAVDVISSASQPSSGHQPAWLGVPGQISMADIVKKGRPQSKASRSHIPPHKSVNHHPLHAPPSTDSHRDWHSSVDLSSTMPEIYIEPGAAPDQHDALDDEWPLIEQPQAANVSSCLEHHADSEHHPDPSNLPFDRTTQHSESQTDEFQAPEDGDISASSRKMQRDNSGAASLFDDVLYKNMGSYLSHNHAFEHEEVEDVGVSVSSVTANFQELSILKEVQRAPPEEDYPSVVIPNHLQVQTADCSHLSFGSFGSGTSAAFSGPYASRTSRSNLEEAPTDADASSVGHSDVRNPDYYGDESLGTASDGSLVHRIGASAGTFDSPSASQPEELKQENPEVAHGNQYSFPSSSPGYTFENAQQLNTGFTHSQMTSQMQNLAPFSSVMQAYSNSLPSTLLAANVNPVRESDIPYSPFPMTQSMPTKYSDVSSISGSTISMAEALKTTGFSSTQPTPPSLPGASVALGPALPQHLAVHPYSQPALPLAPIANMIGYPFLPQSYTYMQSAFQQAFAANNSTYHQSLAAILPQYKNSVAVSSLPQSAAVASGYGAFGSSATIPGNYPMNPPSGTSIGYDDVMSSQYKDSNHLISLQQNENSAMWLHGTGSRTMSAVPASTYYSYQGQNQQAGGFRQGQQPSQNYGALGYPNFYHSQTGISLEHQPQNPRDGSLGGSQGQQKQSQQIWQNSY